MKNKIKKLLILGMALVMMCSIFAGCGSEGKQAQVKEEFSKEIVWDDMFGEQPGKLVVKPASSEWVLSFENTYGAYEISGTYDEAGKMTCTDDAGMGTFLPFDEIFGAGEPVIKEALGQ